VVDRQELAELLKRYQLGGKTVIVEKVWVDGEWFGAIQIKDSDQSCTGLDVNATMHCTE
jgi:hypothetical protein